FADFHASAKTGLRFIAWESASESGFDSARAHNAPASCGLDESEDARGDQKSTSPPTPWGNNDASARHQHPPNRSRNPSAPIDVGLKKLRHTVIDRKSVV